MVPGIKVPATPIVPFDTSVLSPSEEDVRLLNWLELKDFRDGYKMYDQEHTPKLGKINHPDCIYQTVEAYIRINKDSTEELRRLPTPQW